MATTTDQREPIRGRCTTPDGLEIATYDFGGDGPDLLLVHATGFCAGVFTPMARHLAADFHCWGIDLRAHGRSDSPPDRDFSWSGFGIDVLSAIDHLGLDRPYGFGHSCGGAAVLLAEESLPGTFRALYCYEPVVFPGPPAELVGDSMTGNPMSEAARRRRETFPSPTDAFLNFSSKPPFGDLDPDALQAYVDCGFETLPIEEGGDGETIRLRCRREDEAEIYAHGASHDAYAHLGEVGCPVWLVGGDQTSTIGRSALEADAEQLPASTIEVVPGVGHFGPLQRPDRVAASIIGAFDHLR
ncbi:MAG TPA: alpha/beta hydrolase [Acidimicrobiales bacterium]|nr:alpha/beta hydrolase [Acidimicrobiales bacterium]